MIYPVGKCTITQVFGVNPRDYKKYGLAGHNGVDWAVPSGTAVLAAESGIISEAAFDAGGYGNYVEIDHLNGLRTIYAHLQTTEARVGQLIDAGMIVGRSGNTGNSTGPHLHFTVKVKGQEANGYKGAVDPMPYLSAPEPKPLPKGSARVTAEVLNIRLIPGGRDVGDLLAGDILGLAGEPVEQGGITWQPVVLWVAADWLEK